MMKLQNSSSIQCIEDILKKLAPDLTPVLFFTVRGRSSCLITLLVSSYDIVYHMSMLYDEYEVSSHETSYSSSIRCIEYILKKLAPDLTPVLFFAVRGTSSCCCLVTSLVSSYDIVYHMSMPYNEYEVSSYETSYSSSIRCLEYILKN